MGSERPLTIAQAGASAGVAPHVLRHWESMNVLAPQRTANRQRAYTAAHLAQIRLVQRCQAGGLSLAQVRSIMGETGAARRASLVAHRQALRGRAADVAAALGLVEHALACTHPSLVECAGCRARHGPGRVMRLTPAGLQFVRERHLATLTSLRPDGSPHVTPVGFTLDASGAWRG